MVTALVTDKQLSSLVKDRLTEILGWPDETAAEAINNRIKAYNAADHLLSEKSFSEFGRMAYAVQTRGLWKLLDDKDGKPFKSFNNWAKSFEKVCRAKLFESKKVYEELRDDLSDEEMDGISRGNLKTLLLIPSNKRSEVDVLEAARNQEPKEFHNYANTQSPDLHLGKKTTWKLSPTEDQLEIYHSTLDTFKGNYRDEGGLSDEDALEYLMNDYSEQAENIQELKDRITELEDAVLKAAEKVDDVSKNPVTITVEPKAFLEEELEYEDFESI